MEAGRPHRGWPEHHEKMTVSALVRLRARDAAVVDAYTVRTRRYLDPSWIGLQTASDDQPTRWQLDAAVRDLIPPIDVDGRLGLDHPKVDGNVVLIVQGTHRD